ncbi:MAG: hypothetical protein A2X86_15180 [Bdellovibrionales bacterium GWA2_49_15]|nr:MAG: hypothetical protein A2X86_15180 [Bdellovibrionales bacterium GWA2_49_15]
MDSKNSLFFIVVPLGFEDVAQAELREQLKKLSHQTDSIKQSKGGLEVELPLEIGLALNHLLRIPTRILLRLEKFRCRDFPKLYKKTQTYPWAPFLLGKMPKLHVTAKKSRMIHTGRIEESITKGLQDYFKGYPPSKALQALGDSTLAPPDLYVDFYDDNCQWSLNISGEPLYIRSMKGQRYVMEAPIRENLAAALMAILLPQYKHPGQPVLIDPMGGSGVFLSEAWAMGSKLDRPFAYQFFKKNLAVQIPDQGNRADFSRYLYRDLDSKALEAARHNLAPLIEQNLLDLAVEDLFQTGQKSTVENTVLIVNPPYGVRLSMGPIGLFQLFMALIEKYSPKLMGLIIPKDWAGGSDWSKVCKLAKQKSYRLALTRSFSNGGLDVVFVIWERAGVIINDSNE